MIDVLDLYINKGNRRVKLIDINPWASHTDSLLFTWEDLVCMDSKESSLVFLILESQAQTLQAHAPLYSSSRLPKEVIDFSNGSSIEEFAAKFQQEIQLN